MKKIGICAFIALLLGTATLESCKKKSKDVVFQNPKITMTVDGKAWESGAAGGRIITATDTWPTLSVQVIGDTLYLETCQLKDSSYLSIDLPLKPGKVGSYSSTANSGALFSFYPSVKKASLNTLYINSSYTVDITKWDAKNKRFSGNFTIVLVKLIGTGAITVPAGEFIDVKFD
jgi:hypothetical protein